MDKYKNDPTNEYETFKEETNEDRFYALENHDETVLAYVSELENRIREKNKIAQQLHDALPDHQTLYKKLLTKLIKL